MGRLIFSNRWSITIKDDRSPTTFGLAVRRRVQVVSEDHARRPFDTLSSAVKGIRRRAWRTPSVIALMGIPAKWWFDAGSALSKV